MDVRRELIYERHDLPDRYWEPEPPDDYQAESDADGECDGFSELPFM